MISVISFYFCRKNNFGSSVSQFLSRLLLYIINPCLMLKTFDIPYDAAKMRQFIILFFISLLVHLLLTAVSFIFVHSKNPAAKTGDSIDRLAVIFTNCGFIGIPLINGVFGPDGVFYLLSYIAAFNVYFWTFGEYSMSGQMNLKKLITNPNIIAIVAGFVIFCLPVRLPEIISRTIVPVADLNTATAMIFLGLLFANFKNNGSGTTPYFVRLSKILAVRLLVGPAVILAVLRLLEVFVSSVPDIRTMLFVVLIGAGCPVGVNISTFAVIFKRDTSYSSLLVLLSSAFCIITLPLFVRLAEVIL